MGDSTKLNEAALRALGMDVASINALREMQSQTSLAFVLNSILEGLVLGVIQPIKAEDTPNLMAAIDYSSTLNELRREIELLRAQVSLLSDNQLREQIHNVEHQLWPLQP